jgi:uncharacterized metal-binding protein YceD (DUF177 family)
MSQYAVPFHGLANGQQHFDFNIDNRFFDFFEQQTIQGGKLSLNLDITRNSNNYILNFTIIGYIAIQCDICLDWFNFDLDINDTINARTGDKTNFDTTEDFVIFGFEDHQIDISPLIFELIMLNIPMKHEHPLDKLGMSTCNSEMLKELENYLIDEEEKTDPRWDELKILLNKTKENGTS